MFKHDSKNIKVHFYGKVGNLQKSIIEDGWAEASTLIHIPPTRKQEHLSIHFATFFTPAHGTKGQWTNG